MTLDTVPLTQRCQIRHITDPDVQLVLLRFGLGEGDELTVCARPRGGPAVLRCGQLEVALGRQYLTSVVVEPVMVVPAP